MHPHKTLTFLLVSFYILQQTVYCNTNFTNWYQRVANPRKTCDLCTHQSQNHSGDIILKVSSEGCDEGFDWAFSIDPAKKKQPRSVLNGDIKVTFDKPLKDGMKYGICLWTYRSDVHHIEGTFNNNLLQGQVRITLKNEEFLIGFAQDSKLIGPIRHFDSNLKLTNFTYGNAFALHVNSFNNFISINDGSEGDYVLNPEDSVVFKCLKNGHLNNVRHDCLEIDASFQQSTSCLIKIESSPRSDQRFILNLLTMERQTDGEYVLHNCSGEWVVGEEAKEILSNWLKELEHVEPDAYWRMPYYKNPLKDDLSFRVQVPEWDRDLLHGDYGVNAFGKDFGFIQSKDGKFDFHFRPDDIENVDYSRPLILTSKAMIEHRPGLHYGNTFEEDEAQKIISKVSILGRLKDGALNGIVRRFGRFVTDPNHQCREALFPGISFVGRYESGNPVGPSWRVVPGGGLLYGETDGLEFTGDNLAYIYPDLDTVIIGKFENGLLVEGKEASLSRIRCVKGMVEAGFTEPLQGPSYHYEPPTNETFGDQPLVRDPLDKKYIETRISDVEHELADEGAFALRDIPAHTTISIYSGMLLDGEDKERFNKRCQLENTQRELDPNSDEAHAYYKYHASFRLCRLTITIPLEASSTSKLNSTLGHKLNHSFEPNCEFGGFLDTPRFGLVRAFPTLRDIKKGEELFISYGYGPGTAPPWYDVLYKEYVGRKLN